MTIHSFDIFPPPWLWVTSLSSLCWPSYFVLLVQALWLTHCRDSGLLVPSWSTVYLAYTCLVPWLTFALRAVVLGCLSRHLWWYGVHFNPGMCFVLRLPLWDFSGKLQLEKFQFQTYLAAPVSCRNLGWTLQAAAVPSLWGPWSGLYIAIAELPMSGEKLLCIVWIPPVANLLYREVSLLH